MPRTELGKNLFRKAWSWLLHLPYARQISDINDITKSLLVSFTHSGKRMPASNNRFLYSSLSPSDH